MTNPFDPRTVFMAKHAQHVVLIHFPIALFISAVAFDFIAQWTKRSAYADVAYYNLLVAAFSALPVLATGATRVAISIGRAKTERHSVAPSHTCLSFNGGDLASMANALRCPTEDPGTAGVPLSS
jgi:uncharacterized membrane protein